MSFVEEREPEVEYRLTPLGRAMGCLYQIQAELNPLHPLQARVRVALESLDQHARDLAGQTGSKADGT